MHGGLGNSVTLTHASTVIRLAGHRGRLPVLRLPIRDGGGRSDTERRARLVVGRSGCSARGRTTRHQRRSRSRGATTANSTRGDRADVTLTSMRHLQSRTSGRRDASVATAVHFSSSARGGEAAATNQSRCRSSRSHVGATESCAPPRAPRSLVAEALTRRAPARAREGS